MDFVFIIFNFEIYLKIKITMIENTLDDLYREFMDNTNKNGEIFEFVEFLKEKHKLTKNNEPVIIDREPVYGC